MARFTGDAVIREARVVSSWVQSDLLYRVALDERLDCLERLARELALACRVEVLDELTLVDQRRDALRLRAALLRAQCRTVCSRHGEVFVAEERISETLRIREGFILLDAVVATADDGTPGLGEIMQQRLERQPLIGSSACGRPRIEPQEQLLALKVTQLDGLVLVGRGGEIWGKRPAFRWRAVRHSSSFSSGYPLAALG